eukprot:CAMPEP_0174827474 /NCGR_PEP_ID=MMETSP1114-20130205/740_1 /TAXON_ID=312471 /ORGANISM="Neobodo designis, Strain CCAP 1951/1" /LENGTH=275 /DNA_ID=CAMNT_0016061133 /DNA_START=365 /DNA_END=1192 /DNA_ORIENTATION=+
MGCTCSCLGGGAYDDPEKYGAYVRDPVHRLCADYNARVDLDGDTSIAAAYRDIDECYSAKSGGVRAREPDEDTIEAHRGQYVLGAYIRHGITGAPNQFPAPPMPHATLRASVDRVSAWLPETVLPWDIWLPDDSKSRSSLYASSPLKPLCDTQANDADPRAPKRNRAPAMADATATKPPSNNTSATATTTKDARNNNTAPPAPQLNQAVHSADSGTTEASSVRSFRMNSPESAVYGLQGFPRIPLAGSPTPERTTSSMHRDVSIGFVVTAPLPSG